MPLWSLTGALLRIPADDLPSQILYPQLQQPGPPFPETESATSALVCRNQSFSVAIERSTPRRSTVPPCPLTSGEARPGADRRLPWPTPLICGRCAARRAACFYEQNIKIATATTMTVGDVDVYTTRSQIRSITARM